MSELRLFFVQRASAMLLAVMVAVHLAVVVLASQGGLSAEEILGRTRSTVAWPVFYGLFAVTAATHAAIGLRTVLREWTGCSGRRLDGTMLGLWGLLVGLGLYGVAGIA